MLDLYNVDRIMQISLSRKPGFTDDRFCRVFIYGYVGDCNGGKIMPVSSGKPKLNRKLLKMAELSFLTAIIFIMSFTPLGYLKIGPLSVTFLAIPVAVGAIVVGKGAGIFLGAVFGITSFIQCFGTDPMGVILLEISPVRAAVVCIIPRVLMGVLIELIFAGVSKLVKMHYEKENAEVNKTVSFCISSYIASFFASALNTVFFLFTLYFLYIDTYFEGTSVKVIILTAIGTNAIVEAIVCTVVGGSIGAALLHAKRNFNF